MQCSQQESKFYPAQALGDHYKRSLESYGGNGDKPQQLSNLLLWAWVSSALLHMEPFTPVLSGDKMLPIWILHCLALEVAFYICFAFAEPDCSLISAVVAWALQQGSQVSCLRFVTGWLRTETRGVFSMGRENQSHMPRTSDSLNAKLGVALVGWKGWEEKYKLNMRK